MISAPSSTEDLRTARQVCQKSAAVGYHYCGNDHGIVGMSFAREGEAGYTVNFNFQFISL